MSTKLTAKEALTTFLSLTGKIAALYAYGLRTQKRYGKTAVIVTEGKCDVSKEVSADLLANALAYELFKQRGKLKLVLGSENHIYPGKGMVKTYMQLFSKPNSEAVINDVISLNNAAEVFAGYPASSMYICLTNRMVPAYIEACQASSTPVFSKTAAPGVTVYVSKIKNGILAAMSELFSEALNDDDITDEHDLHDTVETLANKLSDDYASGKQMQDEEELVIPDDALVLSEATLQASPTGISLQAAVEADPEAPEQSKQEEEAAPAAEEKKYALTEEEFVEIFTAMTEEGKERWANKLRPMLEEKKKPYVEQLQQIAQMQVDLDAQAKLTSGKIEQIDALIAKLSAFFTV